MGKMEVEFIHKYFLRLNKFFKKEKWLKEKEKKQLRRKLPRRRKRQPDEERRNRSFSLPVLFVIRQDRQIRLLINKGELQRPIDL